jgi:hypothetical protein
LRGSLLLGWAGCEVASLAPLRDVGASAEGDATVLSEVAGRDGAALSDAVEADGDTSAGAETSDVDVEVEGGPLVAAEAWRLLLGADDPWEPMRPADMPPCEVRGVKVEAGTFEVDTALCDWATFGQASAEALAAGDGLEVVFWYGPSAARGEAVAALAWGDEVVWEAHVALPTAGGFLIERVPVDSPHERGTEVRFHIHNHGANTWTLGAVSRISL